MGFVLGVCKLLLVVACFRLANETEEWKYPASLYAFGFVGIFLLDGEFQADDFAQLAVANVLAVSIFWLLERVGGAVWGVTLIAGMLVLMVI